MAKNLKDIMQKEFDKDKNYEAILSKISSQESRKEKMHMKYLLIPACAVIAMFGIFLNPNIVQHENPPIMIVDGEDKIELNIVKIDDNVAQTQLDVDVKIIEMNEVPEEFEFITKNKVLNELGLKNNYCLYTRENLKTDEYNILHDYVFEYSNKENTKNITVAFSKEGKPLRDYFFMEKADNKDDKLSKINDLELKISQYKNMYIIEFSFNDINFDIETNGLTQDELVEFLKSIVA